MKNFYFNIAKIGGANYLSKAIFVLQNIILANILGPALLGVWKTLQIILHYVIYSHFGSVSGMNIEIPFLNAKKEYKKKHELINEIFTFVFISIFIVSILIFLLVSITSFLDVLFLQRISLLLFLLIIVNQVAFFFQNLILAERKFNLRSRVLVLNALLSLVFPLIFAYYWEILGLVLGLVIAQIITIFYIYARAKTSIKLRTKLVRVKNTIRLGFPIVLKGVVNRFYMTIDKIMVLVFLGVSSLGFYGVAISITDILRDIPKSAGQVIAPYIYEAYGKSKKKVDMIRYFESLIDIFSFIIPYLLIVISVGFPIFIKLLLPAYEESIVAGQILTISMFWVILNVGLGNYIIAIGKQWNLVAISLITALISLVGNYIFLTMGYNIEGVALATGITYIFYFKFLYCFVMKDYGVGFSNMFKKFGRMYFAFFINLTIVIIILNIFDFNIFAISSIIGVIITWLLFTCLNLPFFIHVNKKTNFYKRLMTALKYKIGGKDV